MIQKYTKSRTLFMDVPYMYLEDKIWFGYFKSKLYNRVLFGKFLSKKTAPCSLLS